jgi:hypothetical protein
MISEKVFNETARLLLSNVISLHSQVVTLEVALLENGILQQPQIEAIRKRTSEVEQKLLERLQTFDATADPSRIEAMFRDIQGNVQ